MICVTCGSVLWLMLVTCAIEFYQCKKAKLLFVRSGRGKHTHVSEDSCQYNHNYTLLKQQLGLATFVFKAIGQARDYLSALYAGASPHQAPLSS